MFGLGDSSKKRTPGRESIITSERTDYDRKNGIILFDKNVFVDDELFKMHSDRLWVFLNASNELSRIVAIGSVAFTNEMKSAKCSKATYSKDKGRVVLFGESDAAPAVLSDRTEKGEMTVRGRKITYYPETDLVTVEGPVLTAPAAAFDADKKRKNLLHRNGGNAR